MNIFKTAKVIKAPKANSKPARAEIDIDGIEEFAAVDSMWKNLETIRETLEVKIKEDVIGRFIEMGVRLLKRPDNFIGVEGRGSASCELRKRTSKSALKDDEKEILNKHKIPYGEDEVKVQTYIINPEYLDNEALMSKVSKALERVGLPSDFILFQEGVTNHVVEDASLEAAFRLKADALAEVLPILTTVALKPKLENTDLKEILNTVHKSLGLVEALVEEPKTVAPSKTFADLATVHKPKRKLVQA